jgi:hypothetical protein
MAKKGWSPIAPKLISYLGKRPNQMVTVEQMTEERHVRERGTQRRSERENDVCRSGYRETRRE